jgi:hypothetical protein
LLTKESHNKALMPPPLFPAHTHASLASCGSCGSRWSCCRFARNRNAVILQHKIEPQSPSRGMPALYIPSAYKAIQGHMETYHSTVDALFSWSLIRPASHHGARFVLSTSSSLVYFVSHIPLVYYPVVQPLLRLEGPGLLWSRPRSSDDPSPSTNQKEPAQWLCRLDHPEKHCTYLHTERLVVSREVNFLQVPRYSPCSM